MIIMRKTPITLATAAGLTLAAALAVAACGSSPASPVASPSSAAPASSAPAAAAPVASSAAPAAPAATAGLSCAAQMTAWLAAQAANATIPADVNQQVISAIVFGTQAYLHYGPADPAAGQNFLNDVATEVSFLGSDMPSCADPGQDFAGTGAGSFTSDATSASTDTPGTPAATTDSQAVTTDLAALNAELVTTAPGIVVTGLPAGTTW